MLNDVMNECLTMPQHKRQIGYWVSEKGKCNEMVVMQGVRLINNGFEINSHQ